MLFTHNRRLDKELPVNNLRIKIRVGPGPEGLRMGEGGGWFSPFVTAPKSMDNPLAAPHRAVTSGRAEDIGVIIAAMDRAHLEIYGNAGVGRYGGQLRESERGREER